MSATPSPALMPVRAPKLCADVSNVPAVATVAARGVLDTMVWAVSLDTRDGRNMTTLTGAVAGGGSRAGQRVAAAVILALGERNDQRQVRIVSTSRMFTGAMHQMREVLPPSRIHGITHESPSRNISGHNFAYQALDAAEQDLLACAPGVALVATDASMGRASPVAGTAWVRPDGRCRTETLEVKNIHAAELRAIASAVYAHRRFAGTLEVLCDSRVAIAMARQALDRPQGVVPGSTLHEERALAGIPLAGNVHLRWVKGHAGHELNETADSLAVLARRHAEAGLAPSVTAEHADRIASGLAGSTEAA